MSADNFANCDEAHGTGVMQTEGEIPDSSAIVPAYVITDVDIPNGLTTIVVRRDMLTTLSNCLYNNNPGDGQEQKLGVLDSLAGRLRVIGDLQYGRKRGDEINNYTETPYNQISVNYVDGNPRPLQDWERPAFPQFRQQSPFKQPRRYQDPRPEYGSPRRNDYNQPNNQNQGYGNRHYQNNQTQHNQGPRPQRRPFTPRPQPIPTQAVDRDSQEYWLKKYDRY